MLGGKVPIAHDPEDTLHRDRAEVAAVSTGSGVVALNDEFVASQPDQPFDKMPVSFDRIAKHDEISETQALGRPHDDAVSVIKGRDHARADNFDPSETPRAEQRSEYPRYRQAGQRESPDKVEPFADAGGPVVCSTTDR